MKQNMKCRWDILLIATLLAAGAALYLVLFLGGKEGEMVEVRVDGKIVAEYSLDVNAEYTIEGVDGGSNHLRIEDGEVRIDEASCPDKLCMHMGGISKVGQTIVCLPNRVVVEVISADGIEGPEVDVVVG